MSHKPTYIALLLITLTLTACNTPQARYAIQVRDHKTQKPIPNVKIIVLAEINCHCFANPFHPLHYDIESAQTNKHGIANIELPMSLPLSTIHIDKESHDRPGGISNIYPSFIILSRQQRQLMEMSPYPPKDAHDIFEWRLKNSQLNQWLTENDTDIFVRYIKDY
ncbi:hypothetical protein JD969_14180 [Planctomycetota bacterium]|nr:hypothetical protein JD969_14180 [Planctomycetota bacterium]